MKTKTTLLLMLLLVAMAGSGVATVREGSMTELISGDTTCEAHPAYPGTGDCVQSGLCK